VKNLEVLFCYAVILLSLSINMLTVVVQSVPMLSVVMPAAIRVNVIQLSVMAPSSCLFQ